MISRHSIAVELAGGWIASSYFSFFAPIAYSVCSVATYSTPLTAVGVDRIGYGNSTRRSSTAFSVARVDSR